jgi:hypothetical protein
MRLTIARIAAMVLLMLVLLYAFSMRPGRYQLERMDAGLYVVIDTATAARWVYRAHADYSSPGEPRIDFRIEDAHAGSSIIRRLYPERWDMR